MRTLRRTLLNIALFSRGAKHGNRATTCFGHEDLEGCLPVWGTSSAGKDLKKHIMCCSIDRAKRNLRFDIDVSLDQVN